MRNALLSLIIIVVIYGIVINNTYGRVNRKTHALSKLLYITCYLSLLAIGFFLNKVRIHFVLPIVMILSPYFYYKYLQISIKRLHDLDYSGWNILLTLVPIVCFYYIYILYFKFGNNQLNQYDYSINYSNLLRKSNMSPKIGLVYKTGTECIINSLPFTLRNDNNENILQCPKMDLDAQTEVKKYLLSNFNLINVNILNAQYFYFIQLDKCGINKIIDDLNALYIENSRIIINNIPVFIRDEDFKYALLYSKEATLSLIKKDYIKKENPYYNHYLLTRNQLIEFLKESRLTTAST